MLTEDDLKNMSENVKSEQLQKNSVYPSPFNQFAKWFEDARKKNIIEPNAMVLSTASKTGDPSSRVVLLKDYSEAGFIFFTNYNSRKGKEIAENPHVSLNFWWGILERQIRIEGIIEKISAAESDVYFYSRPKGSQTSAIASPQSDVITSREWLEQKFIEVQLQGEIKRPQNWGGYIIRPLKIEFWQGRTNRLHDRLLYVKTETGSWEIKRLAP